MNGVCTFTGLTPSTVYTVVTTGKANELQANGSTVAKPVAPDAPFTTAAAPDTTPPSLTSNQNLPASNIGQITTDILTFSEAI